MPDQRGSSAARRSSWIGMRTLRLRPKGAAGAAGAPLPRLVPVPARFGGPAPRRFGGPALGLGLEPAGPPRSGTSSPASRPPPPPSTAWCARGCLMPRALLWPARPTVSFGSRLRRFPSRRSQPRSTGGACSFEQRTLTSRGRADWIRVHRRRTSSPVAALSRPKHRAAMPVARSRSRSAKAAAKALVLAWETFSSEGTRMRRRYCA
jgi:hypothetical protein